MKISKITIAPQCIYSPIGPDNRMRATVKLDSEKSTVETVLSDDDLDRILLMVKDIIADAAARNIEEFVRAVQAVDALPTSKALGDLT